MSKNPLYMRLLLLFLPEYLQKIEILENCLDHCADYDENQ